MMIRRFKIIVAIIFLLLLTSPCIIGQTRVIIDLDIDSDVDDVSALSMLNNMHNAGTTHLIGVIVTSDDSAAAFCAGAINTYFGNGKIPIGILHGQQKLTSHSNTQGQSPLNSHTD